MIRNDSQKQMTRNQHYSDMLQPSTSHGKLTASSLSGNLTVQGLTR